MNTGDWLRRYLSRLQEAMRGPWRSFNRWRRERWPVRVVILLLLGAYGVSFPLFGPDLPDLVGFAIVGIFAGSEPRLVTAGARAHKAREADRLRWALRAYLDSDGDGAVGADEEEALHKLGLEPGVLRGLVQELDLDLLAEAARRAGLVPATYTARRVRHTALCVGLGYAEEVFGPARRQADKVLGAPRPSTRNWSLYSWWWAARSLLHIGMSLFGMIDPVTAAAWLFLSYFGARLAVQLGGRRARLAAPWALAGLVILLGALSAWQMTRKGCGTLITLRHMAFDILAALPVFTFCAAYAGSRGASPGEDRRIATLRTVYRLGIIVLAWSILSTFFWVLFPKLHPWIGWIRDRWWFFWHSGRFMMWSIPLTAKTLGAIVGLLTVAYVLTRTRLTRLAYSDRLFEGVTDAVEARQAQLACIATAWVAVLVSYPQLLLVDYGMAPDRFGPRWFQILAAAFAPIMAITLCAVAGLRYKESKMRRRYLRLATLPVFLIACCELFISAFVLLF